MLGARYLHGHESIVDKDFLCKEIGSDGCLVASAKLLVDLNVRRRMCQWSRDKEMKGRLVANGWVGKDTRIGSSSLFYRRRYHQG